MVSIRCRCDRMLRLDGGADRLPFRARRRWKQCAEIADRVDGPDHYWSAPRSGGLDGSRRIRIGSAIPSVEHTCEGIRVDNGGDREIEPRPLPADIIFVLFMALALVFSVLGVALLLGADIRVGETAALAPILNRVGPVIQAGLTAIAGILVSYFFRRPISGLHYLSVVILACAILGGGYWLASSQRPPETNFDWWSGKWSGVVGSSHYELRLSVDSAGVAEGPYEFGDGITRSLSGTVSGDQFNGQFKTSHGEQGPVHLARVGDDEIAGYYMRDQDGFRTRYLWWGQKLQSPQD